jgi:hypothetical protein
MNTEQKTQLKESMERIVKAMERWEKAREIAKDIIAWTMKDARRFVVEIASSVGTKIIYGFVTGTERYISYGEELNDTPLRQIYERFFEDSNALVNMISKLADAVVEVAEQNIEELEEQLK